MFCPKCGTEYREGFNRCADCDVGLVLRLPEPEPEKPVEANDDLATIATFDLAFDAERARSILDADGIKSFVLDGNVIGLNQTLTWAAGGVRLQVLSRDLPKAQNLLSGSGFNSLTDGRYFSYCPSCGSRRIKREGLSKLEMIFAVLLFGALLLYLKRDFACLDCHHEWRS